MKRMILAALAATVATGATAADGMKPGLYSYTMKIEVPGMPFPMPPMTAQQCLSQADIDQGRQYQGQQSQECQTKNVKQSPGKATLEFACKDGTTGTGEYTFASDTMTGKTAMTKDGQTSTTTITAKRVGDCK